MTTVVPIDQYDRKLTAATRWVVKISEGELAAEERQALADWLAADADHEALLLEAAAVWDKTDSLSRLADVFPREPANVGEARARGSRAYKYLAAACVALLAVVLFSQAFLQSPRTSIDIAQTASYETSIGKQKTVLLPDGSEIVLNTDSAIDVTYTAVARVLRLERGEVFVKVAEDNARPLSVIAGNQIVQAKGTEFSVEITNEQNVEVLVTEGRVVIGVHPQTVAGNGTNNTLPPNMMPPILAQLSDNTLSAGEEVTLGSPYAEKRVIEPGEIAVKLSWQRERLIFRSEPLEKALQEVERYTTVEFVLLDESLKSKVVSGSFKTGDVEGLLASLRQNGKITHEIDGQNRILLSSL